MPILYTYYGDDFTGSTDVLEQFGANGVPAVLFLGTPTPAHLAAFPNVQAIGIAGDSRSRSPEWMSANLPAIFQTLRQFRAPITHYKTCSTFDSSPAIGSIGRAIEIGREVFTPAFVPIVVGAPHLRRYVAFGHLFAGAPDGPFSMNLLWDRAIAADRARAVVHDGLWFHLSTPADLSDAESVLHLRQAG